MAKKKAKTTKRQSKRSTPKKTSEKLNTKQEKFVQKYILSGNGTAAAIAAGYSERTAASQASRLLETPKIKEAISKLQEKGCEEFKVTREDLYEKYNQAFKLGALVGAPAAMVSAATGMARLFGLDKYKVEHEGGLEIIVDTGIPSGEDDSGETG